MAATVTVITKITHDLLKLQQQRGTGELILTQKDGGNEIQWRLFFCMGRLIYATGGNHRVRRWYRLLHQHCPALLSNEEFMTAQVEGDPWEAHRLDWALKQGWVTQLQVKAVIEGSVKETVFGVVGQASLESEWRPGVTLPQSAAFLSVEQVLKEAQELREDWKTSGLGYLQQFMPEFSPDLAPVARDLSELEKKVSPAVYQSLLKLMQGKTTLWDIAAKMQRPLAIVMRPLVPLIQKGSIELKVIADLPAPKYHPVQTTQSKRTVKGIIACIDDSPVISQTLEQILAPAGYEVLPILNPLQGIATLLERRPAMIFLDLIMPNTNGYELCTFLRKTSAFQNTPIIILTGHDGVIDRVRAKMAGSSEFLSKPPDAEKVLQMVEKYLGEPKEATQAASQLKLATSAG